VRATGLWIYDKLQNNDLVSLSNFFKVLGDLQPVAIIKFNMENTQWHTAKETESFIEKIIKGAQGHRLTDTVGAM